jgi:hypothetical protein
MEEMDGLLGTLFPLLTLFSLASPSRLSTRYFIRNLFGIILNVLFSQEWNIDSFPLLKAHHERVLVHSASLAAYVKSEKRYPARKF